MIIGKDGPAVVLDARACAWLEQYARLSSVRKDFRGTDPHISQQLEEIRYAAMAWWRASASTGTEHDSEAEVAAPSKWLTTGQAADLLGITSRAVRLAIARGDVPAEKVGTHNRISRADVEHYRAVRAARAA